MHRRGGSHAPVRKLFSRVPRALGTPVFWPVLLPLKVQVQDVHFHLFSLFPQGILVFKRPSKPPGYEQAGSDSLEEVRKGRERKRKRKERNLRNSILGTTSALPSSYALQPATIPKVSAPEFPFSILSQGGAKEICFYF
ncbi:uncharacterized protein ACOB8E_005396 [Sarcophilus harrisii]